MSAQNQLILHRGAREATLDQIARVVTPRPTDTWFPIPHLDVLEAVEETLQAASFEVRARRLALSSNELSSSPRSIWRPRSGPGSRSRSESATRSTRPYRSAFVPGTGYLS